MVSDDDFRKNYEKDPAPVVIYGARPLTELVLDALRSYRISPDFLCDGRTEMEGEPYLDFTVIGKKELLEKHHDSYVLICLAKEFWTVYDWLESAGFTRLYHVSRLIANVDVRQASRINLPNVLRNARQLYARLVEARTITQKLALPAIGIVVTDLCTLKCRFCSNLIPFLQNKKHYPSADVLHWIYALTKVADEVVELTLLGGEPFLYVNLPQIIDAVADNERIYSFSITTNGSILPSPGIVAALKRSAKAYVHISDYGKVSGKTDELFKLLRDNGIAYESVANLEWRDYGDLRPRRRTEDANRAMFADCIAKHCFTILNGRLYRCGRSAFGARTGKMPFFTEDSVDLSEDPEMLKEHLRAFVYSGEMLMACDYCNGMGASAPIIPMAEQL